MAGTKREAATQTGPPQSQGLGEPLATQATVAWLGSCPLLSLWSLVLPKVKRSERSSEDGGLHHKVASDVVGFDLASAGIANLVNWSFYSRIVINKNVAFYRG